MKQVYRKLLYRAMCAISTTRLTGYESSMISVRNESTYTLKLEVSFFDKVIKTFDVKKQLHFHQHSFKNHYDYWDKLIATRKDVGAIWLPFITIK